MDEKQGLEHTDEGAKDAQFDTGNFKAQLSERTTERKMLSKTWKLHGKPRRKRSDNVNERGRASETIRRMNSRTCKYRTPKTGK